MNDLSPQNGITAGLKVSRRSVLGALTAVSLSGVVGCTDTSVDPGESSVGSAPTLDFDIPDSGAALPTEEVAIQWMDSGDTKTLFFDPFFSAHHDKHPNLTVNYEGANWSKIQQQIVLGIRNGTEPDVFQLPPQISIPNAVENKWIGAYDDVIPNWQTAKQQYPPGVFANGVTDFDGKTYAIPLVGGQRFNNLLMFNAELVKRADVDLSQPVSWDTFRTLLQTLTKQGAGKYYGIIMQLAAPNKMAQIASTMAQMAGLPGTIDGIDWRTGEYNFTNPLAAEAIEQILAWNTDKTFFPGSTSLDDAGGRARFPQGVASVIFNGPWDIDDWRQTNPSLQLDLSIPPQKDPSSIKPISFGPGGAGKWVYKAGTAAPTMVGDIFNYLVTSDARSSGPTASGPRHHRRYLKPCRRLSSTSSIRSRSTSTRSTWPSPPSPPYETPTSVRCTSCSRPPNPVSATSVLDSSPGR